MEQYHTLDEYTDKYIGKEGTPEREEFEKNVEAMIVGSSQKITIHRGTHEIGGCITEYEHDGWKVFVDYGEQLPGFAPSGPLHIEGLTCGDLSKSILLITHNHGDHIGKIFELAPELPIGMGELTRDIQLISSKHRSSVSDTDKAMVKRLQSDNIRIFQAGENCKFGPFTITPLSVDHSAFDAYAFLIQVGDVKIFHTGDFRTHGFRSGKWDKLIKSYVGHVDYVVCEGTNVSRPKAKSKTERQVQCEFAECFRSHKANIVYVSTQNIDRIYSIIHAAERYHRIVLMDWYQKQLIDKVRQVRHVWQKSKMYQYGDSVCRLKEEGKDFMASQYFIDKLTYTGYVLIARANKKYDDLIAKLPGEKKQTYLSMWSGYITKDLPAYNEAMAKSVGKDYLYLHTSGHCDMESLGHLFDLTTPAKIIAIHTDDNEAFTKLFGQHWNVVPMQDGQTETLIHI
jgi:ribonuclease J